MSAAGTSPNFIVNSRTALPPAGRSTALLARRHRLLQRDGLPAFERRRFGQLLGHLRDQRCRALNLSIAKVSTFVPAG